MNSNYDLFTVGYYICEYCENPKYLHFDVERFFSVSDCLCDHEPCVTKTHGWQRDGDKPEYLAKLGLDHDSYLTYSEEVNKLFHEDRLFMDGRFLYFNDARYFYEKYFSDGRYSFVRIRADKSYKNLLAEDIFLPEYEDCDVTCETLGCDVLGWDGACVGFHSFLCNSLQDLFEGLKFTQHGIADVDYAEAEKMADIIIEDGTGEPVEWLPFTVEAVVI